MTHYETNPDLLRSAYEFETRVSRIREEIKGRLLGDFMAADLIPIIHVMDRDYISPNELVQLEGRIKSLKEAEASADPKAQVTDIGDPRVS